MRTCEAYAPHSIVKCGSPVTGRTNKRYCSRACQNRDQKWNWRAENRIADIGIRLGERRRRRLQAIERDTAAMKAYAEEFRKQHPEEAAFVDSICKAVGL